MNYVRKIKMLIRSIIRKDNMKEIGRMLGISIRKFKNCLGKLLKSWSMMRRMIDLTTYIFYRLIHFSIY